MRVREEYRTPPSISWGRISYPYIAPPRSFVFGGALNYPCPAPSRDAKNKRTYLSEDVTVDASTETWKVPGKAGGRATKSGRHFSTDRVDKCVRHFEPPAKEMG